MRQKSQKGAQQDSSVGLLFTQSEQGRAKSRPVICRGHRKFHGSGARSHEVSRRFPSVWFRRHGTSQLACVHATGHSLQSARGRSGQNVWPICHTWMCRWPPRAQLWHRLWRRILATLKSADGMLPAPPGISEAVSALHAVFPGLTSVQKEPKRPLGGERHWYVRRSRGTTDCQVFGVEPTCPGGCVGQCPETLCGRALRPSTTTFVQP